MTLSALRRLSRLFPPVSPTLLATETSPDASAPRALVTSPSGVSQTATSATPALPPSLPTHPIRTAFSVTLQLARGVSSLVAIVRHSYRDEPRAAHTAAVDLATGVLRGARDRSRDPDPRPLIDQQRRTSSLTSVRERKSPHPAKPAKATKANDPAKATM
jgi:hypothetical protein